MAIHVSDWSNQDWTRDRIERFYQRQNYRMAIGLRRKDDNSGLVGAIGVFQGRGKYLQLQQAEIADVALPESLQSTLQKLENSENPNVAEAIQVGRDLVSFQAQLINRLQRSAGRYVDRVLAVAVDFQGLSTTDFDGKTSTFSFYQSVDIAEQTGANILDAADARDVAAGGNSQGLLALPFWLMHAIRFSSTESAPRLLVRQGKKLELYVLPTSDGADDFVPRVSMKQLDCDLLSQKSCVELIQEEFPGQAFSETIYVGDEKASHLFRKFLESWPKQFGRFSVWDQHRCVESHDAVALSFWGVLFADQMPGNLPDLTGANSQRILGRITPGLPVRWRHLLQNMNDALAPTMRLRDAI